MAEPPVAATPADRPELGVHALGAGAAAVRTNSGVVQTGPGARAVTADRVSLGTPGRVKPPPDGLVGLPVRAQRVFVGRDEQLAELDAIVRAGAGVVAQTVHGLGGVGKTELALQYATRHRTRYRVVWWLVAEDPEKLSAGLAELAFALHPDVRIIATQQEAADWARAWLQTHDGWLLILDNVEDRRLVEPLLGRLTRGHLLITTRLDVGWEDITDGCLRLDVLTPAAAVALLAAVSERPEPEAAAVLAGELGCLPLALRQAGAYLRQTRTSMDDYLRRLRIEPAALLAQVAAGGDAHRAVARTWTVTTKTIAGQDPLAVRVLQVMSCLAPDALPRDVLKPLGDTPADVDQALGLLASYNMITLTDTTVAVHRLVQAVTAADLQQSTGPDDAAHPAGHANWNDTLDKVTQLLKKAAPPGSPQTAVTGWPRWTLLGPHITALAAHVPDSSADAGLVWLLAESGLYDGVQGRHRQAEGHQRRALTITETALGPDHPTTAVCLNNLANTLSQLGRNAEAEPLHQRALSITETALGPDHPTTATRLNNLAYTLSVLGRAAEAEPLHRRALSMTETALGLDHPTAAVYLNNLANTLSDLGRNTEAEPLRRRALSITEAAFGPDHPTTATRLNNLAYTLSVLGRAAEAEPLHQRALSITETALGPDHPTTATRLDNLAGTLRDLGQAAEAEPLRRRALSITEAALGPDHPTTATRLSNLAGTLRDLGRAAEAEPLHRRALSITEAALGPDHPTTATRLNNLAYTLRDLGRAAEAEPLHQRAQTIKRVSNVEQPPD